MIVPILTILASAGARPVEQAWRTPLETGNYRRAWLLAEEVPRGIEQHRARATILYRAGDPGGALAAAEAGLKLSPEELELLYYAAGAAVWLEDSTSALSYSARLLQAVDSVQSAEMLPSDRTAWRATALNLLQLSKTLGQNEASRRRAVGRARAISTGGLGAALLLTGWAAWRYGRSSRPVS